MFWMYSPKVAKKAEPKLSTSWNVLGRQLD